MELKGEAVEDTLEGKFYLLKGVDKEHLRAMIWPRQQGSDVEGKRTYRYVVVGMLVTGKRIVKF